MFCVIIWVERQSGRDRSSYTPISLLMPDGRFVASRRLLVTYPWGP